MRRVTEQAKLAGIELPEKPPYRVPTMEEARAVPENGVVIASLFAGAGGSCLGYRMAGCRVAWANEFLEVAARVHEANFPDCTLDRRDVREVQPEEVLEAIGIVKGELDVLDGSPPCQPFSSAGRREKTWGKKRKQSDGTDQRSDDLTFEFTRLLRGIQPRAFIVENVAGMARGKAKGYFLQALREMRAAGYDVDARILDAQWLGVPQTRARLIYVGVREDLERRPAFPTPLPYRYSVRDAIPWITSGLDAVTFEHVAGFSKGLSRSTNEPSPAIMAAGLAGSAPHQVLLSGRAVWDTGGQYTAAERGGPQDVTDKPCPAITASSAYHFNVEHGWPVERRKFTILELKRICSFPDDFDLLDLSYAEQWARLGNSVPPLMMRAIAWAVVDGCLT